MSRDKFKYQNLAEFSYELGVTNQFYTLSGDEKAKRCFYLSDKTEGEPFFRMAHIALQRDSDNLKRAQEAVLADKKFISYLAEQGFALRILNSDEQAKSMTSGLNNGVPWFQLGKEISVILPIYPKLEAEEVKSCVLRLYKILTDAHVTMLPPQANFNQSASESGYYLKQYEAVQAISERLFRDDTKLHQETVTQDQYGKDIKLCVQKAGFSSPFLFSTRVPSSAPDLLLPFSYTVALMQPKGEIGLVSEKNEPIHIVDRSNYTDDMFDIFANIRFTRADLKAAGISEPNQLITPELIGNQEEAIDELIGAIKDTLAKELEVQPQSVKPTVAENSKSSEQDDFKTQIDNFYKQGAWLIFTGAQPSADVFGAVGVEPRLRCIREDVLENRACDQRFLVDNSRASNSNPENRLYFSKELEKRFGSSFLVDLEQLHKQQPQKAEELLNIAAHARNYFLNIQGLKLKQHQLNTPTKTAAPAEQKAVVVNHDGEAGKKPPVQQQFPQTYSQLWGHPDNRTDLARAKMLLKDYIKGGFLGRLFTLHLGRHHADAVELALAGNYTTVQSLVNAVIEEIGKKEGAVLNPVGSVARRLNFIAAMTNGVTVPELHSISKSQEHSSQSPSVK